MQLHRQSKRGALQGGWRLAGFLLLTLSVRPLAPPLLPIPISQMQIHGPLEFAMDLEAVVVADFSLLPARCNTVW